VLDTNVIVAGLRSRSGLSYQLLARMDALPVDICLLVALVLEYEAVLKRPGMVPLTAEQVDSFLDFLSAHTLHPEINYLWRPFLRDPKDDLLLELAVNANASIVTYNLKDFQDSEKLGVRAIEPAALFRNLIEKGWTP